MVTIATRFGLGNVIVAGLFGGLVFGVFEMIAAAATMGANAAFVPLRMIGAMALGAGALDPGYPVFVAAVTGLMIHTALSIVFALIFATIASPASSTSTLTLAGIVYGMALWLMNFYVIAPLMGWRWFPTDTIPAVQFVAHTLLYGCPVGWYLARSRDVVV
jgi:uncharacterized membrane protein YagU involved in acid resistance